MKQPRSERPASAPRPARRLLTEFTTPAAGNAAAVTLSPTPRTPRARSPAATQRDQHPSAASDPSRWRVTNEPAGEAQDIAECGLARADDNVDNAKGEDDAISGRFKEDSPHHDTLQDDALQDTWAAAEAAKDYRSSMFEHMKANLNATLDYANGLASMNSPTDVIAHSADQAREQPNNTSLAICERSIPTAAEAAEDYRAKAFDLMKANVNSTLEFAQRLAKAKSPAEFIELSASHARNQLGMIIGQTTELVRLAQTMTTFNVERIAAGFAKAITGPKE
jgi:hypothetical protein